MAGKKAGQLVKLPLSKEVKEALAFGVSLDACRCESLDARHFAAIDSFRFSPMYYRAAAAAGVSRQTLNTWLKDDELFSIVCERARCLAIDELVNELKDADELYWRKDLAILQHLAPKEFGTSSKTFGKELDEAAEVSRELVVSLVRSAREAA